MCPTNSDGFAKHVGCRISFYRKHKKMSQLELASAVHKTKSTLSKYESGQISMDIDTLYEIAAVLGVGVNELVDMPSPNATPPAVRRPGMFTNKNTLYIYYYDGRTKRVVKTLMQLLCYEAEHNITNCLCYMDAPSFSEYESCKYFYAGVMTHFELITYVTLNNRFNPTEQIGLCILNPFQQNQNTWGLMFGISFNPISPFGLKFLLSDYELPNDQIQQENLSLSKNELKMMKNLNMMLLNTQEP